MLIAVKPDLAQILSELALRHHVIFNYDTDLLANKFVSSDILASLPRNLDRILTRLLSPYNIKFQRTKHTYILYQEPIRETVSIQKYPTSLPAIRSIKSAFSDEKQPTFQLTGNVVTTTGEALPGVTIVLKNTSSGTTTSLDGTYTLSVPERTGTLVFSYIGYATQEYTFAENTTINVQLAEDTKLLNEIVITGYSIENRRDVTGAVSIGSFGGNQPLYIVDGVPTQSIPFVNPNDIETTTVLKDAASASIYGARAAAGVIVLTTKKGQRKVQKLSVSYDGLYGVTDQGKGLPILNPQEQADWTWQSRRNDIFQTRGTVGPNSFTSIANGQYGSGQTPVLPDYLLVGKITGVIGSVDLAAEQANYNVNSANGAIYNVIPASKQGTDWYKSITRVAPMTRHTLGISGGTETSRYYLSLGMQRQAGIVRNNDFSRYSFRANTEFDLSKKLRFGENIQVAYVSATGLQGTTGNALGNSTNNNSSVASDENDILSAFRMAPIIPVYNSFGGYAGTAAPGFSNPRNPVASRDGQANNLNHTVSIFGNAYVGYDLIPSVTLKSSLGGTYFANYANSYARSTYENSENVANYTYTETANVGLAWTFTNTAQYKQTFGKHDLSVLAGLEALNTGNGRSIIGSGINSFSTDPNYVTLSTTTPGATRQVSSTYSKGNNFYSIFGQAKYTYNDRYITTVVIRRDGSSQFGPSHRFGVFPAISVAWRISAEEFMKDLPWVSDLKIRSGYGLMGNSNYLSSTNQFNLFSTNAANGYDLGATNNSIEPGYYASQIGNADAKWETSITSNIGIDGSFFNNRLEMVIDFWRKDTKDLLYQLALPSV
ncbi:MAG: SusC/RagA family TonB-linked outer membrane protein, partial [Cytophagaceae bacterium]